MADAEEQDLNQPIDTAKTIRSAGWWLLAVLAGLAIYGWLTREQIAGNIIQQELSEYEIPATYEIVSIGPQRQVLRNVVVGDPDRPDLTVEQVEVFLRYRFGTPTIGRVRLVKPRLFGTLKDGKPSFGSLDKVIYAESAEPPALPDIALELVDGRALIESEFGPMGFKAEGSGELDHGFVGTLAATAPRFAGGGCISEKLTVFGKVTTSAGKPKFDGPLRLRNLKCEQGNLQLTKADVQVTLEGAADLASVSGTAGIRAGPLALDGAKLGGLGGVTEMQWREGQLTLRYDLDGKAAVVPQLAINQLSVEGILRMRPSEERSEIEAEISGSGITHTNDFDRLLAEVSNGASGTPAEPLTAKLHTGLARELDGASLHANLIVRQTGSALSVHLPSGSLRGANGTSLLTLSQVQFNSDQSADAKLTGNFTTSGRDLPQIRGRMERASGAATTFRLRMDQYRAGTSSVSIPALVVSQRSGGAVGFSGKIVASGPLPGGRVEALELPIDGAWSSRNGLSMWTGCQNIRFGLLALQGLELARQAVSICPDGERSIVSSARDGFQIAAASRPVSLIGRLGESPISITTDRIEYSSESGFVIEGANIALGQGDDVSRFALGRIDGRVGGQIDGTFAGTEVYLDTVPLDMTEGQGQWNFADGVLSVDGGQFRLLDRAEVDRFNPLVARDAVLALKDNVITAHATLRNPRKGVEVTNVDIRHDLNSGTGHADIDVPGLNFSKAMQPEDLTDLVVGIIALVDGTVTGNGRIDWNPQEVTSSGSFTSEGLDLAAAFGPIYGLNGTIHFTDLLALTTAPNQELSLEGMNPGVFVADGKFKFDMRDGQFVSIKGGTWPFMGGTLTLRPVELDLLAYETRRYVIEIVGADAAQFLATMDMGNLAASGIFDGTVPLVFDGDGNGWIEEGLLISRPPGGNLSYVGDLTYEDMSAMANFAFDMLRSIDFRQMLIEMEGPLTGEIVTRVQFDGVKQGEAASKNFVTKQIAKLPIKFKVNIRAPFYQLIGGLRSTYDASFIRDPRELGLLESRGGRFVAPATPGPPANKPEEINPDKPAIQPEESESKP